MSTEGRRERILAEAKATAQECRHPNWSGYSSDPVTDDALFAALRFIDSLPDALLPDEWAGAAPDGSLCFEWSKGRGRSVAVIIDADGTRHFSALIDGFSEHGSGPEADDLPPQLGAAVAKLLAIT